MDELSPARVFVTVWLPEALDPNTGWLIYDPASGELMDYSSNVTINDNRAIISYTDGGLGDKDGTDGQRRRCGEGRDTRLHIGPTAPWALLSMGALWLARRRRALPAR